MFYANAWCHHNNRKWAEGLTGLRRISWFKWEGIRACWRGWCNEGLNNSSSPPDIVRVIKSRSMGWRECRVLEVEKCIWHFVWTILREQNTSGTGWIGGGGIAFIWLGSSAVVGSFRHYNKPIRSWKWRQHIRSQIWHPGTSLGGVTTRDTTVWVKETSRQHSRLGRDRIRVAL